MSFEATSAPAANPFGGIFSQAALYKPASFTPNFLVGAASPDDRTDRFGLHLFAWTDEINVDGTRNDGARFMTIGSPGDTMFQFGNLLCGTSTPASNAIPSATLPGASRWNAASPTLRVAGVLALMAAGRLRRAALR